MQQVTVGTKNQIVIPKYVRDQIADLKPGAKVSVYVRGDNEIVIKTDKRSWVDRTAGLMSEAWRGIDPIKELEQMKSEWETKLTRTTYAKIPR